MRITLVRKFRFEAAHFLPTFPPGHKCRRMHGHSFHAEIEIEGETPEEKGYLVDFGEIKAALDPLEDALDHRLLNDVPGLENPSAEMIAKWIYDRLKVPLPMLVAVRLSETCNNAVIYRGPDPRS